MFPESPWRKDAEIAQQAPSAPRPECPGDVKTRPREAGRTPAFPGSCSQGGPQGAPEVTQGWPGWPASRRRAWGPAGLRLAVLCIPKSLCLSEPQFPSLRRKPGA